MILPPDASPREILDHFRTEAQQHFDEWDRFYGPDCFEDGSSGFLITVWELAKRKGAGPVLQKIDERHHERQTPKWVDLYEELLEARATDTPPMQLLAGMKIPISLKQHVWTDFGRAKEELRDQKDPSIENAKALLTILKSIVNDPSLEKHCVVNREGILQSMSDSNPRSAFMPIMIIGVVLMIVLGLVAVFVPIMQCSSCGGGGFDQAEMERLNPDHPPGSVWSCGLCDNRGSITILKRMLPMRYVLQDTP